MDKDAVDEGVDAGENDSIADTDIENLNRTIKQLSTEVAELQTELDTIKQTEFQTTEENIRLSEVGGIVINCFTSFPIKFTTKEITTIDGKR